MLDLKRDSNVGRHSWCVYKWLLCDGYLRRTWLILDSRFPGYWCICLRSSGWTLGLLRFQCGAWPHGKMWRWLLSVCWAGLLNKPWSRWGFLTWLYLIKWVPNHMHLMETWWFPAWKRPCPTDRGKRLSPELILWSQTVEQVGIWHLILRYSYYSSNIHHCKGTKQASRWADSRKEIKFDKTLKIQAEWDLEEDPNTAISRCNPAPGNGHNAWDWCTVLPMFLWSYYAWVSSWASLWLSSMTGSFPAWRSQSNEGLLEGYSQASHKELLHPQRIKHMHCKYWTTLLWRLPWAHLAHIELPLCFPFQEMSYLYIYMCLGE